MTLLTPEELSTICRPSMAVTLHPSASLSPASIPFRLRLMVCLLLPRMLRRRPRRLWLMLLVLLMNSVLSRNMFLPLELERTLFPMLLENLRDVFLMLRIFPSSLAKPPWLSLKERSVSSRLSLPAPSPALERPPRLTRELSARPRSLPLPRVRTRRTRTVCLSLPASCRSRPTSSRLRRLRRLPPSTWLSSARPSRSLRRLRSQQLMGKESSGYYKEAKKFYQPVTMSPNPYVRDGYGGLCEKVTPLTARTHTQWMLTMVGVFVAGVGVFAGLAIYKKDEKFEREVMRPLKNMFM